MKRPTFVRDSSQAEDDVRPEEEEHEVGDAEERRIAGDALNSWGKPTIDFTSEST